MKRLVLALVFLSASIGIAAAAFIAFGVNGTVSGGSAPVITNATASLSLPVTTNEAVNTMTASNSPTSWAVVSCSGCTNWFAIDNSGNVTVTSTGASSATAGTWVLNVTATNGSGTSPSGTDTITISATITGVTVAGGTTASYTSGISSGTSIGSIAVQETGGTFGGTIALGGTDAAKFDLSGSSLPATLNANGSTPTCVSPTNYSITITPTQSGVTNSGTPYSITVTCNPASSAEGVGPSATLYGSHPYYTCVSNKYVSTTGSGGNNGDSAGSPWNLSTAQAYAAPAGTCINFAPGVYSLSGTNPMSVDHGGTGPAKTQYVVWRCTSMPFSFSAGALQGEGTGCVFRQSGSNPGSLFSSLTSYLMFDGLEFDGNAFAVQTVCLDEEGSNSGHHHIWIMNSDIHGCGQSGIQWNETDWLFAIHNVWHDNSSTNGVSGSGHSFYEPYTLSGYSPTPGNPDYWHSTTTGHTYHIVVVYNYGYHNYNNFSGSTDGEGINMDSFGNFSYSGDALVMGNIVYGNGGEGIEMEFATGYTGHLDIINNTTYSSGWNTTNPGTFAAGIYAQEAVNMTAWNNIIYEGGTGRSCLNGKVCTALDYQSTNSSWLTNMSYPSGQVYLSGSATYPLTGTNHNTDGTNPNMTSLTPLITVGGTGTSNFALQAGSPAIGFGRAFDLWQQSGTVDAGACPYSSPGPVTSCPGGGTVGGTVTFDAAATAKHATASSITSNSITIAADANYAVVAVASSADSDTPTCTLNGNATTLINSVADSGDALYISYYGQASPASGAQTATCTWLTNHPRGITVVSFKGVGVTPTTGWTSATGSSTTPSLAYTNASGAIVLDTAVSTASTIDTPTCTATATDQVGTLGIAVSRSTSVNPTCSWTAAPSGAWLEAGVSVQP